MMDISPLMPCTVITKDTEHRFPDAYSSDVREDGHLIIVSRDSGMLAAFAPGQWQSVIAAIEKPPKE